MSESDQQIPVNVQQPSGEYADPAYRFSVVYKDGRILDQEDDLGRVVLDHISVSDWNDVEIYALRNRPGDHVISVNFSSGDFAINNNVIKPMVVELDMFTGEMHKDVKFKPVYGRRIFSGEAGTATFFYCGWEATVKGKKIRRVMYVSEHGQVFYESIGQ
jgi:hypothetical protein